MQPDKNTPYTHHSLKTKVKNAAWKEKKKWTKTLARVSYLFSDKIVRQTEIAQNRSAAALLIWNDFKSGMILSKKRGYPEVKTVWLHDDLNE